MQSFLDFSEEVAQAIKEKTPILALESTLITHGLPFPQNIEVARMTEVIAREHHVTPATIAILNGKIKIGLSSDELVTLVHTKNIYKASCRDLAYMLSAGLSAGTTVASTLFCAQLAGIKVFATGGIGGVHRGDHLDISADLIELSRTPIAVICAGAKAILDLPRTLEFLETHNIPIVGYRTSNLPAFYSANSPYKLSQRIDDIKSLVKMLTQHWQLQMPTGIVIANPIPLEDEITNSLIEPAIVNALTLAVKKNISGKEITPFLLEEVAKATQGKSIKANISLIINNVKLGAELAYALVHGEEDRTDKMAASI